MKKIGFIGLGIMGSRMAANLLKKGFDLKVYNRTKSKAEALIGAGAEWAGSASNAGTDVDILITMLSEPGAVSSMALGKDGFLQVMRKNALWIDSSTVNPYYTGEMKQLASEEGIRFIDAPVAGSKKPAEKGELLFLAGGDKNDINEAVPLFDAMGKKFIHVGENGKGTSLKMVFNLLLGQAMHSFGEAMKLGRSLELDEKMLFDVLLDSPVVAPFIKLKRDKMENKEFSPEFPLRWMQKDLTLAAETAYEQGVKLKANDIVIEAYRNAIDNDRGDDDFSAIYDDMK